MSFSSQSMESQFESLPTLPPPPSTSTSTNSPSRVSSPAANSVWNHPGCVTLKLLFKELQGAKAKVDLLTIELFNATEAMQQLEAKVKSHDCHKHIPLKPLLPERESTLKKPVPHLQTMRRPTEKGKDSPVEVISHTVPSQRSQSLVPETFDPDETQALEEELEGLKKKLVRVQQEQEHLQVQVQQQQQQSFAHSGSISESLEAAMVLMEVELEERNRHATAAAPVPAPSSPSSSSPSSSTSSSSSSSLATTSATAERILLKETQHNNSHDNNADDEIQQTLMVQTLNFDFLDCGGNDDEDNDDETCEDAAQEPTTTSATVTRLPTLKRGWTNNDDGELSPPPSPPKRARVIPRIVSEPSEVDGSIAAAVVEVPKAKAAVVVVEREKESNVPAAKRQQKGPAWKRNLDTHRLRRMATTDEDFKTALLRMMARAKQLRKQTSKQQRHKRRKSAQERQFDSRTRTMEETIMEGCEWLLAVSNQKL